MAHLHHPALTPQKLAAQQPYLGTRCRPIIIAGVVIGVLGLAAAFALGAAESDAMRHFFYAYLVAFCFWLSIALGGLFYTMIHFLLMTLAL